MKTARTLRAGTTTATPTTPRSPQHAGATAQDTNTPPPAPTHTKNPHSHAVPNRLLSAPPYAEEKGGGGGGIWDTHTKIVSGDCVVEGDGEGSGVLSPVHIYHGRRAGSPRDVSLYDFFVLQCVAMFGSVLQCFAMG